MTTLSDASRIVIKIGSLLACHPETGAVNTHWLATLAADIAALRAVGKQVVVVSSGAVALGRSLMQLGNGALTLEQKQAAAACGQPLLMQAWQQALGGCGMTAAQILITAQDTQDRRRYLNARQTVDTLLAAEILPIVNENDTVTTAEIRYGDNDRLAAQLAAMIGADLLVLFSDVDGLYTANPKTDSAATLIERIDAITPEIEAMAEGSGDARTSGGMATKIAAARIATSAGCRLCIASGTQPHPLRTLMDGGRHSLFTAHATPLGARKHWIAAAVNLQGGVRVNDGAAEALRKGASLLAVGITTCEGRWQRGDIIEVRDTQGAALARGICAYSHEEACRIVGTKSDAIASILGYKRRDELIHQDDMVLI